MSDFTKNDKNSQDIVRRFDEVTSCTVCARLSISARRVEYELLQALAEAAEITHTV